MYFKLKTFLRACLWPSLNTHSGNYIYILTVNEIYMCSFLDLPISSLAQLVLLVRNMIFCSYSSCKCFLH